MSGSFIKVLKLFAFLLLSFSAGVSSSQELTQSEQEAALKSAYLVNFARFVRWEQGGNEVRLCLSTESAIYRHISNANMLNVGGGRELVLSLSPDSLDQCHIYFVDAKSISTMPALVENARPNLLTITDISGSLGKGYAVQFFVRDLKLRFVVDEKLVESSSYQVSSKLLRMSRRLD